MAGILDEFLLVFKPTVQGSGFQKLNKQLKQTHQSLFSVKNLMRTFIGYDIYTGLKSFATGLIDSSKELGAMTSRFYAITHSNELANKELQWTFDLATRTAMPIKALADSYSIFYSATQKGLGTQGSRDVFQSWTEVSRVLHLSEYQFERITYALREMASKGAIYSQDLRMQIGTHVPNAMGLAQKSAESLGITGVDWFKKLQDASKGNQQLINKFIVEFSKNAKKMYASPEALAEALKKPDAQLNILYNTWKKFQYAIVQSGFEKDLVNNLMLLNKALSSITRHAKEIYGITKALLKILLVLLGGKILFSALRLGVVLFRIARIIKAGKFLLFLRSLPFIKSMLPQMAKALPILARFIPFLTNPWVLAGILLMAGGKLLAWFLQKFFPNVFLAVTNILTFIKIFFDSLIARIKDSPIAKIFNPETPTNQAGMTVSDAIKAKRQDIKMHGGYLGNDKYGGYWDVVKLLGQLKVAEQMTATNKMPWNYAIRSNPVQQKFNIQVAMNIKEAKSGDDIMNYLEDNKPKFTQWWGGIFNKF